MQFWGYVVTAFFSQLKINQLKNQVHPFFHDIYSTSPKKDVSMVTCSIFPLTFGSAPCGADGWVRGKAISAHFHWQKIALRKYEKIMFQKSLSYVS